MIITIFVFILISSVALMFRLAQSWWRTVNSMKKPLYAIKPVEDHTSQKMEVEQFATHSNRVELTPLQDSFTEDMEKDSAPTKQAFSEHILSKY